MVAFISRVDVKVLVLVSSYLQIAELESIGYLRNQKQKLPRSSRAIAWVGGGQQQTRPKTEQGQEQRNETVVVLSRSMRRRSLLYCLCLPFLDISLITSSAVSQKYLRGNEAMRLPSSLSIALASGQKTPTNTPRTDSTSDNSDSGSNSDQGHDRYNSRSLIKKHLTWSRHTSPSRRKTHSQQQQQQQQTQTPNSAAASTIKTRSRGASGSASLLRNGGHTETGPERSPRRVDARGLVPDNDPPPSSTTAVIEQSFIASVSGIFT